MGVSLRQPKLGVLLGGLGQHGQVNSLKFCLSHGTPKLGPAFPLMRSRVLAWASRVDSASLQMGLCVCPVGSEDVKVTFARGVIGAGAQKGEVSPGMSRDGSRPALTRSDKGTGTGVGTDSAVGAAQRGPVLSSGWLALACPG